MKFSRSDVDSGKPRAYNPLLDNAMGIFVYLRASRLPFLTGSLFPVAAATALAYLIDHTWNFLFFGLTALGVAALQVGANLINDYYDSFGSDPLNRKFTPFSGGSPGVPDGKKDP